MESTCRILRLLFGDQTCTPYLAHAVDLMLTVLLQGICVRILHGLIGGRTHEGLIVISRTIVVTTYLIAYVGQ